MSRYIDADEIKYSNFDLSFCVLKNIAYKKDIDKIPTADVEPVRHGHWIYAAGDKRYSYFSCSECGERVQIEPYESASIVRIKFPYSHCGAKMDGEESKR